MMCNRDRVVCVMTTGQAWQFRPYKWPEPKQLFHHGVWRGRVASESCLAVLHLVKGVYVSWSNDPPNTKIKDWNVSEMRVCVSLVESMGVLDYMAGRSTRTDDTSTSRSLLTFGKCWIHGR